MVLQRAVGGRKEQIVETALGLLAATSLEALSTRQIAAALGLTQPSLFRHFASRAELIAAVVAHARQMVGARVAAALVLDAPAADRLRALFRGLCEQVERTPGLPRLVFADAATAPRASGHELRGLAAMHRSIAAELFAQGRVDGSIGSEVEPAIAGAAFAALAQGVVLAWQLDGRPPRLAVVAAPLLELLLAGAAPAASVRAAPPAAHASPRPRRRRCVIDVGALLSLGRDPLAVTLAAIARVGKGGAVVLRAPFRPAPLIAVLEAGGHSVRERARKGRELELEIRVGTPPVAPRRSTP